MVGEQGTSSRAYGLRCQIYLCYGFEPGQDQLHAVALVLTLAVSGFRAHVDVTASDGVKVNVPPALLPSLPVFPVVRTLVQPSSVGWSGGWCLWTEAGYKALWGFLMTCLMPASQLGQPWPERAPLRVTSLRE